MKALIKDGEEDQWGLTVESDMVIFGHYGSHGQGEEFGLPLEIFEELMQKYDEWRGDNETFTLTDEQLADVIEKSKDLDHEAILDELPRTKKKIEEIRKGE